MAVNPIPKALEAINVTSPSTAQLKSAKAMIAYYHTADSTSYGATVCRSNSKTNIFAAIWNGSINMLTVGYVQWSKTNGTLTIGTDHSDRSTSFVLDSVTMFY